MSEVGAGVRKQLRWQNIRPESNEWKPRLISPQPKPDKGDDDKPEVTLSGIGLRSGSSGTAPSTIREAVHFRFDHPNILPPGTLSQGRGRTLSWLLSDAGALGDLMVTPKTAMRQRVKVSIKPFPESFLWHTLISLLKAAHYLHTGNRASTETVENSSHWRPVVHNYINPSNVFYMYPHGDKSLGRQLFGTCMLRNFSRCSVLPYSIEAEEEDESEMLARLTAFENKVTIQSGYEAPELISDKGEIPGPASDLWSIGAVIITMMTGRHVWDFILETYSTDIPESRLVLPRSAPQEKWQEAKVGERLECLRRMDGEARLAHALPFYYSAELKILVEGLLLINPLDRGNAVDVLRDVEARAPRSENVG